MNLLLYRPDECRAQQLSLSDRRWHQLLHVQRAKVGDRVRVGELGGSLGRAVVARIDATGAVLQLDSPPTEPPPPKMPVILVLALPRPKMLRRILRSVAEFGAAELHLIHSYRVEKSYWQTPVLEPRAVEEYLLLGLEQARDTIVPPVHTHRRFKPFVEDLLPGLLSGRRALLAHPGNAPLAPAGAAQATVVVIGPEGGFIPYEVDKLQAAGCAVVSLGPRILRVENAVSCLLGRLLSAQSTASPTGQLTPVPPNPQ